jgi:YjbE family integral membrane protein
VHAVAEYLNPALWRDWLAASAAQLGYTAFWLAVLQIIVVNLLLSGDNAVVIALACAGLSPQHRRWGVVIGAGVAVILRIVFIGIVAQLMTMPYLKLAGGLALLLIAAKLVVPDEPDKSKVQAAAHLWRAVMLIAAADIIMSLDNVIAIAAVAQGNFLLLAIGLVVSVPLILIGAALVMALIERFPIFIWAGAGLLGWVAGEVMITDPAVSARLMAAFGEKLTQHIDLAASSAGILLAIGAGGLWRSVQKRTHAGALGANARA